MASEPKRLFNQIYSFLVCGCGCVFTVPFVMFAFALSFCLYEGGLKYMLLKKKVAVVFDYDRILYGKLQSNMADTTLIVATSRL